MTTTRRRLKPKAKTNSKVSVSSKIRSLIKTVFVQNRIMNEAKRKHESARKELYAIMKEEGPTTAKIEIVDEGNKVMVEAFLARSAGRSRNTVNVEKLHKLVDEETFMKIVSATQTAVKEYCPDNVLNECLEELPPTKGTENVTVKKAKK